MRRRIGIVVAFVAFLVGSSAAHAQTPTPTPTPGGDCCAVHSGPSCDNAACNDCICNLDPVCCVARPGPTPAWDQFCVADAADPVCADLCRCGAATPTPGGDCCSAHGGPSCDDNTCRSCVCGIDAECCNSLWDATCVSEASDECAASCPCAPLPTETPAPTPTPGGDCCTQHDGASCDDNTCRSCVCQLDSPCCNDVWDQTCADEASVECALSCSACGSGGDCCAAHDDVGCNDATCKDCVCGIDSSCCTDGWDDQCVSEANVECVVNCTCEDSGSCCVARTDADPIPVGCDNRACQSCVCTLDSSCCDELWDATCADEAANECVERCHDCEIIDCCNARTDAGCPTMTDCETCVCGIDGPCCSTVWDAQCANEAANQCASQCACTASCAGDCGGDGQVTVNDLIVAVNIALGNSDVSACTAIDTSGDGQVSVAELIQAVNALLGGCPS